jgi:hypothetical protein
MTSPELLSIRVHATSAFDAAAEARAWAAAEPRIKAVRITRCRPADGPDGAALYGVWTVELAIDWVDEGQQVGLGL